ncbi:MAG TPA: thiolase family protein [Nitrososphaeraceae archaeon]|nr:thiolase family protein [Nitrososphaeraceae archaeon]
MSKVAILDQYTSEFTKDTSLSVQELACDPCRTILENSKGSSIQIDAVILSTTSDIQYGSTIISEYLGIKPIISQRLDNLCNSGTNAIVSAYSLIKSGLCKTALVVGADIRETKGSQLVSDISRGSFTLPVYWAALFAKAHIRRYGTTEEQMASVAVKNRKNAYLNHNALFRKKISISDVMNSKKLVEPVKMLDCSYICNGASAILLTNEEEAKKYPDRPVWIEGIGSSVEAASFSNVSSDLSCIRSTKEASSMAFSMTNIRREQIDVVELHDAFTIMEILAYEDLGFCQKGQGGKFALQNNIAINPRGGLIGTGHPLGATGVAQTVEICEQLKGLSGKRQVKGCKRGLVHNMSAAGSSSLVLILS